MIKTKTEALIFDLGKVIVDFSVEMACNQVAKAAGISSQQVHSFLFEDGLELRFEAGEISFSDLHQLFEQSFNLSIPSAVLKLAAADIFCPLEQSLELLRILRSKYVEKITFALLSNTNEIHWEHIERRWEISSFFDHTILSFEAKSMKPDEKIYCHALEKIGVAPENCFFVDDLQSNIDGAKRLGIDASLYEGTEKLRSDLTLRGFLV